MLNQFMVKSQISVRASLVVLAFFVVTAAASPAFGQDFTIQASAMNPATVDPGGKATATISLSTLNSTSAVDVSLTCVVTSGPSGTGSQPPSCIFSATPVSTPGSSTITVTANAATLPGSYTLTITGTGPTTTHQTTVIFNVIAVS